jgi:hypothetical protein
LNPVPYPIKQGQDVEVVESSRYAAPPGPRRVRITPEIRAEVVSRYQGGESSRQVAEAFGIAKSTVLNILRSESADVRPQGVRY